MTKKQIITLMFATLFSTNLFSQGAGTCVVFDGTAKWLDVGSNFKFTSAFAIELWAWHNNWQPSSDQTLISNYNAGGYRIRLENDNRIKFYTNNKGSPHVITFSTLGLSSGWHHIACTYDTTAYKLFIDGVEGSSGGGFGITYDADNYTLIGAEAGTGSNPEGQYFNGYIDEIRIWNRVLSESEINDWMNKPITSSSQPSYISNLQGYYKLNTDWSNGWLDDCSGDVGGANDIDATNHSATTTTSYAALGDLPSEYTTDAEAIWRAKGTNNSEASTGCWMNVSSTLSDENFAAFGNNNTSGKSTADLPSGVDERTARIWYVDLSGTVTANVTIDISDATEYSTTVSSASNYKLLYRTGTSGSFSNVASGNSVANNDQITFNSYALQDGYYALGGPAGGLPVKIVSFAATYQNEAILLRWTTASEAGGIGFIIDRRSDIAANWQQIASYHTSNSLICLNNPTGLAEYSYLDGNINQNTPYFYRLSDEDIFGNLSVLDSVEVLSTAVAEISSTRLLQNTDLVTAYPNPFNPRTKINYQIAQDAVVDLMVYNLLGHKIRRLLDGVFQTSGNYTFAWDGTDDNGELKPSGTYVIVLKAGDFVRSKKVLIIR